MSCSVSKFQSGLVKLPKAVPDELPVPDYIARCRTFNSILDVAALLRRDAKTGVALPTACLLFAVSVCE